MFTTGKNIFQLEIITEKLETQCYDSLLAGGTNKKSINSSTCSQTSPRASLTPNATAVGICETSYSTDGREPTTRMIEGKKYNGRTYYRKFDHDVARLRYAMGVNMSQLAREYGVSRTRIKQIVHQEAGRKAQERAAAYRWPCLDCGKGIKHKNGRCLQCSTKRRATSVREDELQCTTCQQWKPDDAFPRNRQATARRGRHSQCQACNTIARRDYRHRHREADNAYQREYKKRKRATK